MNQYPNYVEASISKNEAFVSEFQQASEKFWNSIPEEFFAKGVRHVKVFRNEENTELYILEKDKGHFTIYHDTIHDFEQDKTIEEHMHYPMLSLKEGKEIYCSKIVSFDMKKKKPIKEISNENFFAEILESGEDGKEMVEKIKKMFGSNLEKDPNFFSNVAKESKIEATSNLESLKDYMSVLSGKGFMKNYDNNFFKSLVEPLNKHLQDKIENISIEIEYMMNVCEKNKFNSYKKSFEFNDLDNNIWLKENNLIQTDQNCGFYVDYKNKNNFKIYFLYKEYSDTEEDIVKLEKELKTGTLDDVVRVILSVEDGTVNYVNNCLMWIYELDSEFGCKALKAEGYGEKKNPVDTTSYAYQRDYYFTKYHLSEFQFLTQAFLTLGGGFDYDKAEGKLVDDSIPYLKKLKTEKEGREKIFTDFNYCYPKKIDNLNAEWLDGLKYMVSVLKKDMPKPVVYEGDDPKDAVEKAIKYYELKIAKLNKPKL